MVLVVGGDVADAGVQPHGVVLLADVGFGSVTEAGGHVAATWNLGRRYGVYLTTA
jgi:hypothetical protein